jgi:hypothetical protein
VVSDQTVDLQGDLIVTATGSLTLTEVDLRIHVASNGEHGITVQSGGTLVIQDTDGDDSTTADASSITAVPTTRAYYFIVNSGTTLRILNSMVSHAGHTGSTGNTRLGIFVATDDAIITGTAIDDCLEGLVPDHATIVVTNSSITNSTYHGVDARDSDVTLRNVILADNGYNGARLVRGDGLIDGCWIGNNQNGLQIRTGANVTINDTIVAGNTDGLMMQIDANVIVTGSTFRSQGQYGIRAENRGDLTISDSLLTQATRTALFVFNDVTVTSSGNTFRNNVYGVRLNMDCTMTSTGDTFSHNTNSGIYLVSTSALVIIDGMVTDNSAGIKGEDGSTITSWSTTVQEATFEGYTLTDTDLEVNDGKIINCTGGGIVSDATSTSLWTVNAGNASVLSGCTITLTDGFLVSGDLQMWNARVLFTGGGSPSLTVNGGDQDWQNSTIRPAQVGDSYDLGIGGSATGSAWFVTIQQAGSGSRPVVSVPFEFHRCVFSNSNTGISATSADIVFDRCQFDTNGVGVTVHDEVRFENCSFSSNSVADVGIYDDGWATMVNSSFDDTKVTREDMNEKLSVWWNVHIKVEYPNSQAAPGAVVRIDDKSLNPVFQGTTDGNGHIGNVLLHQYDLDGVAGKKDSTPFTFNATAGSASSEGSVDITGHTVVTLVVNDGQAPVITITSHSDGEYIRNPVLVLTGTAFDAGSSVDRVEARIATQAWQTCSGTDTWTWTVSLPGDNTYPISVRARDVALNYDTIFFNLTLDTERPTIVVNVPPTPANNTLVGSASVIIDGYVVDDSDTVVTAGNVTADMVGSSFTLNLTLVDGINVIIIQAEDPAGNKATLEWRLQADMDAPELNILSPINNSEHNETTITLTGATDPFVDVYYKVMELSTVWSMLTVSGSGGFTKEITGLQQGTNSLYVMVRDPAGNEFVTILILTVDTVPPRLLGTTPTDGTNVNHPILTVTGSYNEPLSSLMIGNTVATLDGTNFTVNLDLVEDNNQFTVVAKDRLGNVALSTLWFFLDVTFPTVTLPGFVFNQETGDFEPFATNQKFYLLLGNTELGSKIYVDRWEFEVDSLGRFGPNLELEEGENLFEIMVRDRAGNEYFTNVTLILDTYAPELTVETPKHLSTTSKDYVVVRGTVTAGDSVAVGEEEVLSLNGTYSLKVPLGQAVNRIVVVASDEAGNSVSIERLVFMSKDTSGVTGYGFLDENCNSLMVLLIIVVVALAIFLSYAWKEEDVLDRREKALESMLEDDNIELDKPHLEPTTGYLQYDSTSETGRKPEFEEKDDEEFISMADFRREMDRRE